MINLKEEWEASTCEARKCQSRTGIEPGTCGLHDKCSTTWAIGTRHDSKQKTDTIKQHTHWQRFLQTSSFLAILPSPRGPATVALLQTSSAHRRILIRKSWENGKFKRRKGSTCTGPGFDSRWGLAFSRFARTGFPFFF